MSHRGLCTRGAGLCRTISTERAGADDCLRQVREVKHSEELVGDQSRNRSGRVYALYIVVRMERTLS